MGLSADAVEIDRKVFRVLRAKSPELVRLSDHTGEGKLAGFGDGLELRVDAKLRSQAADACAPCCS